MSQNFLAPNGFKLNITKLSNFDYFVTDINMPDITTNPSSMSTPFRPIPIEGDTLTYGELSVTFKIDDTLSNYTSIVDWMNGITTPEGFDQREILRSNIYSDAIVLVLNSSSNASHEISFEDIFPISLSGFNWSSKVADVTYLESTVVFNFKSMAVTTL